MQGTCLVIDDQPSDQCQANKGNPVDALTGRKHEEVVDWSSGGFHPLELKRYYSSMGVLVKAPNTSRLANNWRTNFDAAAKFDGAVVDNVNPANADTIYIVLPNSLEYSFKKKSSVWTPVLPRLSGSVIRWDRFRTDINVVLTVTAAGVELRMADGTQYSFDTDGLLTQIAFADGYKQFLQYSGGQNTRVYDNLGRWIDFAYNSSASQPVLLTDAFTSDGKQFSYSYESRYLDATTIPYLDYWALKTVTYPDDTPATNNDNPKRSYEYLNDFNSPFLLTGVIDERGVRYASWTYDSSGRAITSEHAGGADHWDFAYDDANNKVTVTNPLGRKTVYTIERAGQIRRVIAVDGVATIDCLDNNTIYTYDLQGYLKKAVQAKENAASNSEATVTTWTRDARGLPLTTVEGAGTPSARTTVTTWDATRPLPLQITRPGLTTALSYNAAGLVTSMSQTDTATQTVPYVTAGQSRTTSYNYTTITLPVVSAEPTGSALPDVKLAIKNSKASGDVTESGGVTGWTSTKGELGQFVENACSDTDPCFFGGTEATTIAYQDVSVPDANIDEVRSGLRAATLTWRQSSFKDPDNATVDLIFLDKLGDALGSSRMPLLDPVTWTVRSRTMPVPPETRTIRIQIYMSRKEGTNNDGYVDDIALTLVGDRSAAANPFLPVNNTDASGGTTAGWTVSPVSPGTLSVSTSKPCDVSSCFTDDSEDDVRMYQELPIPAARNREIDDGNRGLEIKWMDRTKDDGIRIRAEVAFLDDSGVAIEGASRFSPLQPSTDDWRLQTFSIARVPADARKVRLVFVIKHASYIISPGAYLTGISAQLVTRFAPQGSIDLLSSVDGPLPGTGDTVTYAYDASGNLVSVKDEAGLVTKITARNGAGQPTSVTDPNGMVTTMAYDARGRLTTVTANPGTTQAVTAISYNLAGLVNVVASPDGSILNFNWNGARRLTTVTNNSGETITYTYNANGDVTSTTVKSAAGTITRQQSALFDALGRLMKSVGAAGQTTTFDYDEYGNLTQVRDPRGNLFSYAYDALQRVITTKDEVNAEVNLIRDGEDNITAYKDPRGLTTTYIRNGFGEVIQESGPDVGTTVITRDARGLATSITDPRGIVANLAYDNAGRLLSVGYPSATTQNVTYSYDSVLNANKGKGRLTGMTDGSGTMAWTYDTLGRVTAEKRVIAGISYTVG